MGLVQRSEESVSLGLGHEADRVGAIAEVEHTDANGIGMQRDQAKVRGMAFVTPGLPADVVEELSFVFKCHFPQELDDLKSGPVPLRRGIDVQCRQEGSGTAGKDSRDA